jgi:hypothetical protein
MDAGTSIILILVIAAMTIVDLTARRLRRYESQPTPSQTD